MQMEAVAWGEYEKVFKPIYTELTKRLVQLASPVEIETDKPPKNKLYLIDFIEQHGYERLEYVSCGIFL